MFKVLKLLAIFLFLFSFFSQNALAKVGVGVGSGKIQVEEKLKPGIIYQLPPLNVINTGDEESDYQVSIGYHNDMPQLRPVKEWFIFSPNDFHLKPGEVKTVDIKLNLPLRVAPGDYFCYLEAHPAKKESSGNASIGVAAAAKLYFTVIPASFWQGTYYKIISFFKIYAPWPQRVSGIILLVIILVLFKRFFNLQIGLKNSRGKSGSE